MVDCMLYHRLQAPDVASAAPWYLYEPCFVVYAFLFGANLYPDSSALPHARPGPTRAHPNIVALHGCHARQADASSEVPRQHVDSPGSVAARAPATPTGATIIRASHCQLTIGDTRGFHFCAWTTSAPASCGETSSTKGTTKDIVRCRPRRPGNVWTDIELSQLTPKVQTPFAHV